MVLRLVWRVAVGLSVFAGVCWLAGCGASFSGSGALGVKATPSALTGTVRGGSQPISGSQVYLYAVSTSQDSGPASSLLVSPGYVTTGSDGSFSLAGDFTCPAGAYVYLLAKGGNPGLASGTNNGEIALASGLGLCSAITSSTHVVLNEVTTVATAYSLAAYASSETNIGANNAVPNTLGSAFANIPELINMGTGYALATNASGGIVPQATIDSLANALAACVSSDGTGTLCPSLMTAANVTGANGTPVDTFQAALNIAQNPTVNVQGIFNLPPSGSPFQPSLSGKPNDWTVTVQYPGTAVPPPVYYVSISPGSATIYQEGSETYTVSVTGSASGSGFSYQWTLANHAYGLLNEVNGAGQVNQASYCSTSAQSTYVPNASPVLTSSGGDIVQVSVFTGAGCASASFIGSTAARVSVIPDLSTTMVPAYPTTTYGATVVLPSGSKLTPDQVSVITSVTSTTPLPTGAFTVTEYANGEQIVMVLSPAGNPMLMGWMDSTHPTVSASTTAEVLAFFALGGQQMLNESDRNQMIAGIPQMSAFPALAQAISTEIAANPDAFSTTDANVQAAVAAFYTAVTGLTPAVKQPGGGGIPYLSRAGGVTAKPNSVIPTPSSSSPQSGISVTGQDPTSAYVTNAYRRRTHVFVTRESDITLGTPNVSTDDVASVTDFDVKPAVGLTGGVTGAVSDIFKAYFGTQPTAYAPINSDPFSVPVTSGFDETSYQLLNVGAGGSGAASPVPLTNAQQAVLVTTAVNGLVNDALVPFITNMGFGSGSLADSSSAPSSAAATFQAAFIGSVQTQLLALTQSISGEQDKIVAGDYAGAANDLLWGVGATQFQNLISAAITTAASSSGFNIAPMSSALAKFTGVLKAANAGLQAFDTSVYSAQLLSSDNVDQWTLLSAPNKITLTASTPTINGLGNSGLTTAVLGVSNTNGYSYLWAITPDVATNSTIGTLAFASGATQLTPTSYCSSSLTSTYVNTASAVNALTQAQTDDITVTVFSGSNCTATTAAPQIGKPATATVTTNPTTGLLLDPPSSNILVGGQVSLTATIAPTTNTSNYSYQWTVTPVAPSTTVSGTLTEVLSSGTGQTGQTSYCSASPNANYISNVTGAVSSPLTDTVTVTAYSVPGCASIFFSQSAFQVDMPASATITTASTAVAVLPASSTISQGSSVTLTAKLPSSLNSSGYSYQWTVKSTAGTPAGTLSGVGAATGSTTLTYCSSSGTATYVSNATPPITLAVNDTVAVTAFTASGCASGSQLAASSVPATVTVQAMPNVTLLPSEISSVMEASDGNLYATADNGVGSIYKIDRSGNATVLYATTNLNALVTPLSRVIEGPDGYLYGLGTTTNNPNPGSPVYVVFQLSLSGQMAIVGTTSQSQSEYPPTYDLVLGSDGNFYFNSYLQFLSFSPAAGLSTVVTTLSLPIPTVSTYGSDIVEGSDGNFYVLTAEGSGVHQIAPGGADTLLSFPNLGDSGSPFTPGSTQYHASVEAGLVEGSDGNLYGSRSETTYINNTNGSDTYTNLTYQTGIYQMNLNGSSRTFYHFPISYQFSPSGITNTPSVDSAHGLLVGPDGNFYGTGSPAGYRSSPGCAALPCAQNNVFQLTQSGEYNMVFAFNGTTEGTGGTTISGLVTDTGAIVGGSSTASGAGGYLYSLAFFPNGPVHLSLSAPTVTAGSSVTLNWNVSNAFSLTAQQCYAFVQNGATGAGTWTGKQLGTPGSSGYSGSATITPTAPGSYTYALTCGGVESGFATLQVQ